MKYALKQYLLRYGVGGFVRLAINVARTRLYCRNAKIIRYPIEIRGKRQILIGHGFVTGVGCRLEVSSEDYSSRKAKLVIGNNVQINDYVHIAASKKVIIGDNVLIASKVFISDHNHGSYSGDCQDDPRTAPACRALSSKEVIIGDNVWIGEFVSVLPGVSIGKGSIIGSMSVVTKQIPENSIAVGNPCKVIKHYNEITRNWEKVL